MCTGYGVAAPNKQVQTKRMAKQPKGDGITEADLLAFVKGDSDFGFEMRVLSALRKLEFDCSHSGTYQDPVTNKIRQFDIRAEKDIPGNTLALAVECKNYSPHHPLLLSAVPRTEGEAFHDLLVHSSGLNHSLKRPSVGANTPYVEGGMVGKKADQVRRIAAGRPTDSYRLESDDTATFEKLNQAVNSCKDLVLKFTRKTIPPYIRAVVPVLIVPNGLLWMVEYASDGTLKVAPHLVPGDT